MKRITKNAIIAALETAARSSLSSRAWRRYFAKAVSK